MKRAARVMYDIDRLFKVRHGHGMEYEPIRKLADTKPPYYWESKSKTITVRDANACPIRKLAHNNVTVLSISPTDLIT